MQFTFTLTSLLLGMMFNYSSPLLVLKILIYSKFKIYKKILISLNYGIYTNQQYCSEKKFKASLKSAQYNKITDKWKKEFKITN